MEEGLDRSEPGGNKTHQCLFLEKPGDWEFSIRSLWIRPERKKKKKKKDFEPDPKFSGCVGGPAVGPLRSDSAGQPLPTAFVNFGTSATGTQA